MRRSERHAAKSVPVEDRLRAEFELIKANVAGVQGTLVATSDGFLVAHDVPDVNLTDVAALIAASRALAIRGITVTGRGQFRETLTRGTDGYLAVYAAGDNAIVAVIGSTELNVAMLHFRVRGSLERIAGFAAEFGRWSRPAEAADDGAADPAGELPVRRRGAR